MKPMTKLLLESCSLSGSITIHGSKSLTHRLLIAAALATGKSVISNFYPSKDVMTTLNALQDLGLATFIINDNVVKIDGGLKQSSHSMISCNESGTTFRLLIPIVIAKGINVSFNTQNRLAERPLGDYINLFKKHNITVGQQRTSFSFKGSFTSSQLDINASNSSQFVSGLLMTLPLLDKKPSLKHFGTMVSKNYIDLTIHALNIAGIKVNYDDDTWTLNEKYDKYMPFNTSIEGDYSNASFYFVANSLGQKIDINGLNLDSLQGDKEIIPLLNRIDYEENCIISCENVIDLVPLLALKAALTEGKTTTLSDISRLKDKESNRLSAIVITLKQLGVKLDCSDNKMTINGIANFNGGMTLSSFNDHRIAMMIALASLYSNKPIILDGADVVEKSYPNFWKDFASLGGKFSEAE